MRRGPRGAASWAVLIACAQLVAVSHAEDLLHEYVADVDPDEPARLLLAQAPQGSAIVYGDEVLTAPGRAQAEAAPKMVATPGDGELSEQPGQRSPTFRPDRKTDLEGSLEYFEGFTPSIAPFKRVTSLDATLLGSDDVTPVLGVGDPRRHKVPVERPDARPPDPRPRDRFLGSVKLDFARGRVLPLPSVSPESRMLSLTTEPAVELGIERDGADNFFAVLKGAAPVGEVLLNFATDAPRAYFGTALPHAKLATLAREVPEMPPSVRVRALGFARELGITESSDLAAALTRLTAHFRAFEESSEPPPDSGDIYLDLARAKKGICRHRAYAFVVTAHALGIPARFVQNEAHSWVEVKLPRSGWMRIDLGGAAHGLTAHNASDKPQYQASEPDPLPRPAAYEASYSLLGRDVKGVRRSGEQDLAGRWVAPASEQEAAQASSQAAFMADPKRRAGVDPAGRTPLALVLDQRYLSVLRGHELAVSGRVQDRNGGGVAGARVEVSLALDTRRERMLLGASVSDERGIFSGTFSVPAELAAGDYRLVVVTPGDAQHLPAIAE